MIHATLFRIMDHSSPAENPYSAPQTSEVLPPEAPETYAESVRKTHIKNESSIKSIGILYYLAAFFLILGGFWGIAEASRTTASSPAVGESVVITMVFLLLGGLNVFTGISIRKFKPWARVVCILFAAIGLLGFPLGTLISAYMLYLLLNKKASMIFSPSYKNIIAATPHVKYKTSMVVWILFIVVILLFVATIVGFVATSSGTR